jgi:hypothetical protein
MEYLLYGLEKNETRDYMETLLLVTTDKTRLDTIKQYAIDKGFHSFRIATYNGEKPAFDDTLINKGVIK